MLKRVLLSIFLVTTALSVWSQGNPIYKNSKATVHDHAGQLKLKIEAGEFIITAGKNGQEGITVKFIVQ